MSILEGALLGLLQGLAEFLPISSSGHLNLFQALLHTELDNQLLFNILLHVGTLIAVAIVFWKDWLHMVLHPIKDRTLLLLFIASLPALVGKILFDEQAFQRVVNLTATANCIAEGVKAHRGYHKLLNIKVV